ncbi:hypothetical protein LTR84_003789 [Exophiala bonariae]|uniref:Heterokaryon incompatibility domain-containing protein n=1 Tax=Exophiala bonariae TaxID=1690606 RepID=A0AAV9N8B4_9EURO|nr:hypothetical protein LTR84_003789 [Exophiala bonariae]
MVAPLWQKLETLEQHLDRLDLAVNTIMKHLNITIPGSASDTVQKVTLGSDAGDKVSSPTLTGPYKYKVLDHGKAEIRVLALNGTNDESQEISGSLVHISLEDKQTSAVKRYNALSYTWGEPKMNRRIVIDGHIFFVTQNLENALRQMRTRASRTAGISGDGINQADIEERANQVMLMRRIYKSALYVEVWLGEAVEGSALAMDLINKIGRPPIRGPGQKEVLYPEFSEAEVRQHWDSVRLLMTQPWWERSWIRQEIALGVRTQVFWGEYSVDFDTLSQAVMAIEYADSLGHNIPGAAVDRTKQSPSDQLVNLSFYHHARGIRTLRKNTHRGHAFLALPELLLHSRYCKATDERDKIYSMIGLADMEIYRLSPDYQLSLHEVLKSTARAILPKKKGLRLLGACQNPDRNHNLPSWAPNLVDHWKYHPFEPDDSQHFISTAEPQVEFDNDAMLVKGVIFDSVSQLCKEKVPTDPTPEEFDDVYAAWHRFAEEALAAGHLDESRFKSLPSINRNKEFFWLHFLSTNRTTSRYLKYSDDDKTVLLPEREDGVKMEYMGLNLKLARRYLLPGSSDLELHPLRRIRAALKKYGAGRQLGLCADQKTLVLLPGDARPGDLVAVFRGASFPYVLRKVPKDIGSADQDETVLVGEAFLPEDGFNMAFSFGNRATSSDVIRVI